MIDDLLRRKTSKDIERLICEYFIDRRFEWIRLIVPSLKVFLNQEYKRAITDDDVIDHVEDIREMAVLAHFACAKDHMNSGSANYNRHIEQARSIVAEIRSGFAVDTSRYTWMYPAKQRLDKEFTAYDEITTRRHAIEPLKK